MDRVSVLLPTKGRYEALYDSLISLSGTYMAKELIDLQIVVDDDLESMGIATEFAIKHSDEFFNINVFFSDKRLYPIKAFNVALKNSICNFFCWMNDENSYEPNWLVRNLELFYAFFPDNIGVLSLYKKKKAGLGMTTKQFVGYNYGEWFNEVYKLYYSDDELTIRAILLGRYGWSEDSGVFHDSEITKKVSAIPWDEKIEMKKVDRGIFYQRLETDFGLKPEDIYPWDGFSQISFPLKRKYIFNPCSGCLMAPMGPYCLECRHYDEDKIQS